jgi:hypothetical protein
MRPFSPPSTTRPSTRRSPARNRAPVTAQRAPIKGRNDKPQHRPFVLTPCHFAELLSRLQFAYAQLSAFSVTQDTGLLNNMLRLLGGVVPPLSDVLETVRSILIGDSVTILEQLAIAQAVGQEIHRSRILIRSLLMCSQVYMLSLPPTRRQ